MNKDGKDVGFIEDALFGLQNMIAAENHAIMSYAQTKETQWMDIAEYVRKKRSKLLNAITLPNNSQGYCFSKHILAAAQVYKELGNRFMEGRNKELARECFDDAGSFEALFMFINKYGGENDTEQIPKTASTT